jgi:RNA polymerase-binding protein DksA
MDAEQLSVLRRKLLAQRFELLREHTNAESGLRALSEVRETEIEEMVQEERLSQQLLRLDDRARTELTWIEQALARIEAERYGICEACNGPISLPRLRALPATPHCHDCAEHDETMKRSAAADATTLPASPDRTSLSGREIEEVIEDQLRADGRVDVDDLRVVCRHGSIVLEGSIASDPQRQIVLQIVAEVMGYAEVVDRMQVAGGGLEPGTETAPGRIGDAAPVTVPAVASAQWNVLITAQEGRGRDLKRLLKRHGRFVASGFRNVFLGHVDDQEQFFGQLAFDLERKPFAQSWIGKALPIHTTFAVRPQVFANDVETRLRQIAARLEGRTFHVRVERRGHKGTLNTRDLELRFGEFLWNRIVAQGCRPSISFTDPDTVVAIEIAGTTAGIALIERQQRLRFAFVKID